MEKDSGVPLSVLRTDGGMVGNEMLMQFQADILDRTVVRPAVQETTALGAAYAAGLATGFYRQRGRSARAMVGGPYVEAADGRRAAREDVRLLEEGSHAIVRLAGGIDDEQKETAWTKGMFGRVSRDDGSDSAGQRRGRRRAAAQNPRARRRGWMVITAGMGFRRDVRRLHVPWRAAAKAISIPP